MRLQLLVSTMNQTDYSLIKKMNIKTDAIVINQCDKNSYKEFTLNGHKIIWVCSTERGVGRSRNRAILLSDADILVFADDDVEYFDDYEQRIISEFERNPSKSLITFNLTSLNPERYEYIVRNRKKLHQYNCLKYGAFRIAIKRKALLKNNIFFSLLFGGGAKYQAGEDNLFITNCLNVGIRGLASSVHIGTVQQKSSTWFKGYNEKYYKDRGALFGAMYGYFAIIYLWIFEIKETFKSRKSSISLIKRYSFGIKGIKEFISRKKDE